MPAAAAPMPAPAGVPLGFAGYDPLAAAGYPSAASAAMPVAPQPGFAMPAGAMPGMVGPTGALPAMQFPTGEAVISVPPAGGAAAATAPGAAPGALASAFAGPTLPPGLLPASINSMVPAPPPLARPAAPPAPPIPTGAAFKPQWDELKDFSESDTIVSDSFLPPPARLVWLYQFGFEVRMIGFVWGCMESNTIHRERLGIRACVQHAQGFCWMTLWRGLSILYMFAYEQCPYGCCRFVKVQRAVAESTLYGV
jgi:hypothetical protein